MTKKFLLFLSFFVSAQLHASEENIYDYVAKNSIEEVITLISTNKNIVTAKDEHGDTALHIAVKKNLIDMTTSLLENKSDVNATNRKNLTPLHIAVQNDNHEIISLLLERHAAIDLQNKDGFTPLSLAAKKHDRKTVNLLINDKILDTESNAVVEKMNNEIRCKLKCNISLAGITLFTILYDFIRCRNSNDIQEEEEQQDSMETLIKENEEKTDLDKTKKIKKPHSIRLKEHTKLYFKDLFQNPADHKKLMVVPACLIAYVIKK